MNAHADIFSSKGIKKSISANARALWVDLNSEKMIGVAGFLFGISRSGDGAIAVFPVRECPPVK